MHRGFHSRLPEKRPKRNRAGSGGCIPPDLAAWFAEETPEIGLRDHPRPTRPAMLRVLFRVRGPLLDHRAETDRKRDSETHRSAQRPIIARASRLFRRSGRRVVRNPFIQLLSIMHFSCQTLINVIQTFDCFVRHRRDVTNYSNAAIWNDHRCPRFHGHGRSGFMGTLHEFNITDRNRFARYWRQSPLANWRNGRNAELIHPVKPRGESSG